MVTKEQRRRQLAREKFERQQQRRAQERAKARRRNVVIASALAVLLAAGGLSWASVSLLGGEKSDQSANKAGGTGDMPKPSKAPDPCRKPQPGAPNGRQWKSEPKLAVDTGATYTATLDTTCGRVVLELAPAKAPHTVNSFAFLAGQQFFDHTKCHRLTTSGIFVLQCGDPTGSGSGGPGYQLKDENLKDQAVAQGTYPAGTVAMANAGANTGGSQFFLVYKDSPLPVNYTPFGKITGGMDVLQKIADAGEQSGQGDGAPNATVVIDRFTVTKG